MNPASSSSSSGVLVSAVSPPEVALNAPSSFPGKLHYMLTDIEQLGDDTMERCVHWAPHGRSFVLRDRETFISKIMPRYFYQLKYNSFQRLLNVHGFRKILGQGRDRGGYYHELFLRGRPDLAEKIRRGKGKCDPNKGVDTEPDFSALPPLPRTSGTRCTTGGTVAQDTCAASATNSTATPPSLPTQTYHQGNYQTAMMQCANPNQATSNCETGMRLGIFAPMMYIGTSPPQAMAQQVCATTRSALDPSSLSREIAAAAASCTWLSPEPWQVFGQQSNGSTLSLLGNDRASQINQSSQNHGRATAAATTPIASTLYAGATPSLVPPVQPTAFLMFSSNSTMVGQSLNAACGTFFQQDTEDVDNLLEPLPLRRDSLLGNDGPVTSTAASEILVNTDPFQQVQDEHEYSEPVIHQDPPSFRQQSIQRIVADNIAAVQQDLTPFDLEPTPIGGTHWSRSDGECAALCAMLKASPNVNIKTDTNQAARRHNDHQEATAGNNNTGHVCVGGPAGRSCSDSSCSCLERLLATW